MSSGITTPFGELFLSPGYITYVLLTRPPLTLGLGYPKPRFVRLACLSHAASVRSEPGSNSPVVIRQPSEPARKTGPTRCLRTDSFDRPLQETPERGPSHAHWCPRVRPCRTEDAVVRMCRASGLAARNTPVFRRYDRDTGPPSADAAPHRDPHSHGIRVNCSLVKEPSRPDSPEQTERLSRPGAKHPDHDSTVRISHPSSLSSPPNIPPNAPC